MNEKLRQIFDSGLGDAKIRSIAWTDDNLAIDFVLPSEGRASVLRLCFETISHLRIDMDYGEYVGNPLLFSAETKKSEHGTYNVRIEFGAAPEGLISFQCNNIVEK